jgi:hypothetical protein
MIDIKEEGNWCDPNPSKVIKQDIHLYEPDFDAMSTIFQIKLLLKSNRIIMQFDLNNEEDAKEVEMLKKNLVIKEIKEVNINNN